MRRLQKQAGTSLERRVVHILEVARGLKGFKQRKDLVRFLERSSGELGKSGWQGERLSNPGERFWRPGQGLGQGRGDTRDFRGMIVWGLSKEDREQF